MNRKTEDLIVRHAFGDLSPEEARAIESQIAGSPEAARELELYREMRMDLRALAEVPQEQLSKERLRDAILAQGLKPRGAGLRLGWLWMPASAAALAFALLSIRQLTTGSPELVVHEGSGSPLAAREASEPAIAFDLGNRPTSETFAFDSVESPRPAPLDRPEPVRRILRQRRGANRNTLVSRVDDRAVAHRAAAASTPSVHREEAVASAPPGASADVEPAADSMRPNPASTIVLIQPETDELTGAHVATEIPSSRNVVIGG